MIPITLNLAGKKITFDFDGVNAYLDGELVEHYQVSCGMIIPGELIVETIKNKIAKN